MTSKQIQDALLSIWALPASGLAAANVYFAHPEAPAKAPGPCISISLGGRGRIGMFDQVKQRYDSTAARGQEIVKTAMGPREVTCTLQAFSPAADGTDGANDARDMLSRLDAWLGLPTVRSALNHQNIGVLRQGSVTWQPGIERAGWEGRAVMEVVLCVPETAEARLGYIETANITGTVDNTVDVAFTLEVDDED